MGRPAGPYKLMNSLLKVFIDICLLRAPPQQLPASRFLLGLVLLVHWVLGVLFSMLDEPLTESLLTAMIGTLLPLAVVYGLLTAHRLQQRLYQTATALVGSEVVLGLLALPLNLWFVFAEGDRTVPALLSFSLVGWGVVVATHVFHNALNVGRGLALVFAFSYTVLSITLLSLMAPGG